MKQINFTAIILIAVLSFSCNKKESTAVDKAMLLTTAPAGFPNIPFPEENKFSVKKWELGKKLFYDKMLSVDYSISCASCHNVAIAFSDDVALSFGVGGVVGRRNSPSLTNVAYQPYYTREGGLETLEKQILVPIQEHDELNFNIVEIAKRMSQNADYVRMSKEAFDRAPDAYVITRAIATFERTLVSGNSAYDKYIYRNSSEHFSDAAMRGMNLFNSTRTKCSSCHSGFNFTNYAFENNGLYNVYKDVGRKRLTNLEDDNGKFKVPTLRNIALTAPYMHDGSLLTLADVIEHYNNGGAGHRNQSGLVKPLKLAERDQKDLIAFLESLTDYEFINKKEFYNEEQ